jgi:dTDP-4-dehydrorhamnose 3,5-epimerase-like enzyme
MTPTSIISEPRIIEIPRFQDQRGNLSVIDHHGCLPFKIRRVFYVYDIPTGVERGAHAHRELHQFIFCVCGSIEVAITSQSRTSHSITLEKPWHGLYIPPLCWAHETSRCGGTVYCVATSDMYKEHDYIRDWQEFLSLTQP